MKILEDITFCICACYYPFAEFTVHTLKHFYPDSNILITFDMESQYSEDRKEYFSKNFSNVSFLENKFEIDYNNQIKRFFKIANTKYILLLDDDVIFYNYGIIEYLESLLDKEKYFCICEVLSFYFQPEYGVNVGTSFCTYFCLFNRIDFVNNKMGKYFDGIPYSYEEMKGYYNWSHKAIWMSDTTSNLVPNIIRKKMKVHDVSESFHKYLNHSWGLTAKIRKTILIFSIILIKIFYMFQIIIK